MAGETKIVDGIFFRAKFRRTRQTISAAAVPEICISYSGDDMKPDRVRLPKNVLFSGKEPRTGLEAADLKALETAKARQDHSHRKLDKFIAATIAELASEDRNS
jgi:hypothetical protein